MSNRAGNTSLGMAKHYFRSRPALGPWATHGACRGDDPATWYPASRWATYTEARRICKTCPVHSDCLDHALASGETEGMWGGLDPDQRRSLHPRAVGAGR